MGVGGVWCGDRERQTVTDDQRLTTNLSEASWAFLAQSFLVLQCCAWLCRASTSSEHCGGGADALSAADASLSVERERESMSSRCTSTSAYL